MRQLKPEEWIKGFHYYEMFLNGSLELSKFASILKKEFSKDWKNKYFKRWFREKYKNFKKDSQTIISKTGNSTQKRKR